MKKSSSQFYVCSKGCFSLDPNFQCTHKGGKSQGSSDDLILVLEDEPTGGKLTPGEKIYSERERDRERYEKRAMTIAKRREVIEEILRGVRAKLLKSNQWSSLMHIGNEIPQIDSSLHVWPSSIAMSIRDLIWEMDRPSWSDSK